jgi:hypothetical protein
LRAAGLLSDLASGLYCSMVARPKPALIIPARSEGDASIRAVW